MAKRIKTYLKTSHNGNKMSIPDRGNGTLRKKRGELGKQ